ncbi:PaaI family thioesterase [Sulfitobacter sp. F26204]|uniref:PaaI family thioesterase n=1 Tax=Sulfitobacter sp. F26204 TaxID=2996014 RepID=UPI00225E2EC9|nr:PaaI family thioesterase [Sulfitobacter sp. F26204]MCX7560732.1 PaaI family thioesterase [Sulfitobacter sp. F26204]
MPRIATKPQDLLSQSEALALSGLEFMQSILDGTNPGPPIGATMGYTLQAVEEGRAVFRGTPEFNVTNPMGTVHGGWYGTLLDSAMACAVMTKVPRGSVYTTLEYKINILRALPLGTQIDCIGVTDHVGRSTGVAHGEIRGVQDGKLYATGSTTCIVMKIA